MKGGDTVKAMKKRNFYLEFQLSVAVYKYNERPNPPEGNGLL